MRPLKTFSFLILTFLPLQAVAQHLDFRHEQVDIELVIAVDVSGSVSKKLAAQQQTAFVEAFRSPDLQSAMLSGPKKKVAVTYFEFSSFGFQRTIVPWMTISRLADLTEFADILERSNPSENGGHTSISGALLFADTQLRTNDYQSYKNVVDIAGNGLSDVSAYGSK